MGLRWMLLRDCWEVAKDTNLIRKEEMALAEYEGLPNV